MRMKKKIVAINGESFCRTLTGIERLAVEVVKYLDGMVHPGQMELIVPENAKNLPELNNISIVTIPVEANFFPKWTQIFYQKYCLTKNRYSFNFSNTCPFFCPGFEFIHDIFSYLYPQDFKGSKRDRLIHLYSNIMYKAIAKRAKEIFTVSEYTKQTIIKAYGTNPKKINVVYSGVSDYNNVQEDFGIFEKFPILKEREFYFTLGSLSTRKNFKWIVQHAKKYPDELFAVSGKPLPSVVPQELEDLKNLDNVIMLGYLSDEEVKAIYSKCKAFLLPTYFEGFGLPPLEALSSGAKVIVSNVTSLPEIYGDCAYYIDPDKPEVDLAELLKEPVASPDSILRKYTLQNTAARIYDILKPYLKD